MKLEALPFHIGATLQPHNPGGLPATFPFEVVFDAARGVLCQPATPALENLLRQAYGLGQAFGTPLADDRFGQPYAADFLSFMAQSGPRPGTGLEIGAGVGYLTRRLLDLGWAMTSLEPGEGYEPSWQHYGVQVLREFFPTPRAAGPFDMICCYGVLEHVPDPLAFLRQVKKHLRPGGWLFLAVPDCTAEIREGDPSVLFHEHFSYFEAGSLRRLLSLSGLDGVVTPSGFGRCLYAAARADVPPPAAGDSGLPVEVVASYPARCASRVLHLREQLGGLAARGELGVYCAARGLPLLDAGWPMRFFDDDPALHARYLPPFCCPIENRGELMARPVDTVAVLSRTFGTRIRDGLRQTGYRGRVLTWDDFAEGGADSP